MRYLLDVEDNDISDFCVDCGCTSCNVDFDLFSTSKVCLKRKRIR